jgi:Putative Actinobacterial Holin-X, holin superfamily III
MQAGPGPSPHDPAGPLSIWEATAELVSAGQDVVLDRVELLRTEISHDVQQVLIAAALVAAGSALGVFGWILAMAALVALLSRATTFDLALVGVGLPHLIGGVLLAVAATRRLRQLQGPSEASHG